MDVVVVVRNQPAVAVVHTATSVGIASGGMQGIPGPAGGDTMQKTAAQALGGHRLVRAVGAEQCDYASALDASHADELLGLTIGAAAAGAPVSIVAQGDVTEPSWTWTPQQALFLGANGLLTQDPPSTDAGAAFSVVVGFATSPTSAHIRLNPPVYF